RVVLLVFGCKKRNTGEGKEGETKKAAYTSKGDEGAITGKVALDGTPPTPTKIDMSADANCVAASPDKNIDDVLVEGGKLANVFVYLKGGGIEKYSYPTPSDPVILDQKGCRYHPRTLGIQVNQKFEVTNSDATTHNVHPSPKSNPEWNQSQAQGIPPIYNTFPQKAHIIPL